MATVESLDCGIYETMRKGNRALKEAADKLGMTYQDFRIKLFKSAANGYQSLKSVFASVLTPENEAMVLAAIPLIEAVKQVEAPILRHFNRMAWQLANKWCNRSSNKSTQDELDYYQEAVCALLDAIYGYSEDSPTFSTYAYCAINNRMMLVVNRQNPMGAISAEAIHLLRDFENAKEKLSEQLLRRVNDEEVFDTMNITPEQRRLIEVSQVKVVSGELIVSEKRLDDYSQYRRRDNRDSILVDFEVEDDIQKMRRAIKDAGLNDLEKKVIDAYLEANNSWGWQATLERTNINPRTNKPYSRTLIGMALKNALRKIRERFVKEAA